MANVELGKELIRQATELREAGETDVAAVLYALGGSVLEGQHSVEQLATLCANLCTVRDAVARVPPASLPSLQQNAPMN